MSGEELRQAAMHNDRAKLREYLRLKANPCSADEHGLTALHYAVWNGHVDCVKMIVMNPNGVDKNGDRRSCIDMQSTMGYTALHLAALDSPTDSVRDIVLILLMVGADTKLLDKHGNTAYKLAKENENEDFTKAFLDYADAKKGNTDIGPFKAMFEKMKAEFSFSTPAVPQQTIVSTSGKFKRTLTPLQAAQFPIPAFLENPGRVGETPAELAIPEHTIPSLVETGFSDLQGMDSLRCLKFAKDQALANANRREKLVTISKPDLPPITIS